MKGLSLAIGILGFIFFGYAMDGGKFHVFVHTFGGGAMFMIYGPLALFAFYTHGFTGAFNFLGRSFGGKATESDATFINNFVAISLLLGGMASILGIIITLGRLSEGTEAIGMAIAGALCSVIWASLPGIIFLPLRKGTLQSSSSMLKMAASFAGLVIIGNLGNFVLVMWLLSAKA